MSRKQPNPPPKGASRPAAPPAPPKGTRRTLCTASEARLGPFHLRWTSDEPDKLYIRREGRAGTFTLDTNLEP